MLEVDDINSFYGTTQVLRDFSLNLDRGEVLCLLGRNGAGKTTALKTIMGLIPNRTGSVVLNGADLSRLPAYQIPKFGIAYVPQGRRLFGELSVGENLEIGLLAKGKDENTREQVLELFPRLRERLNQTSGTLSGGEQQMLAMARALCLRPTVLLLDEPTEGLMPSMITTIRNVILKLRQQGVGILLVEQRVDAVLDIANRVAFVENGRVREVVSVETLDAQPDLLNKYVGV